MVSYKKLETRIPLMVEQMMIAVAMREFGGNLSNYTRSLIFADLMKREVMSSDAYKIAMELMK